MSVDLLDQKARNQELFFYWVKERQAIHDMKEACLPKPWTDDPILQNYKFCNVQREDDRVTVWIKNHWRDPCRGHPNMWFAMIVARLFNWPETLDAIGFPMMPPLSTGSSCSNVNALIDWDKVKETWRSTLKRRRDELGLKIFTGAYLVSTNGVAMDKIDYILDRVLTPIWERGRAPRDYKVETVPSIQSFKRVPFPENLKDYWEFLIKFDGLGSFMAGQVVADLKYVDPVLEEAEDWMTFAPLGPGSIRGLNRFFGRLKEKPLKQEQGLRELLEVQKRLEVEHGIELPVHDIQNCMCESDKYIRLLRGEGKVRAGYKGT